jgi:RNA polymerase-binding transcription factor DksA
MRVGNEGGRRTLDPSQVARRLAQAQEEAERDLRALTQELSQSQTESVQELSSYDNHPSDLAAETFEREKDFSRAWALRARLRDIRRAQERLARGEYGRCQGCGGTIDAERLMELPWVALCVACQEAVEERASRQGQEEGTPSRPGWWSRSPQGDAGIDGEDVWQALSRYGSADGPQDVVATTRRRAGYGDPQGEEVDAVELVETLPSSQPPVPEQALASLREKDSDGKKGGGAVDQGV